jgi:hypothetical protein
VAVFFFGVVKRQRAARWGKEVAGLLTGFAGFN